MNFKDKIKALFHRSQLSEETFEELEDLLIEGDIGASIAFEVVDTLKNLCRKEGISTPEDARGKLKEILRPFIKIADFDFDDKRLNIVLILGVNGVGKTTSCAQYRNLSRFYNAACSSQLYVKCYYDVIRIRNTCC